ncbi:MAG: PAS domain-containing protein [Nitrospirae bacterium]|nr:PAS domain-containing protein [Nitrospirota bacterium]
MFPDNKKVDKASQRRQIVLLSISIGALYWIIDSAMDVIIFHQEHLVSQIFTSTRYEIWTRLLAIGILILFGVVAQYIIIRYKQTGDSLRESEKRYRTLAEAAQDMIFIVDRNDVIQYVNIIAAKQFECKPEELIGKRRGELFPAEVASRQQQFLQKVFETGDALYTEDRIVFPNKELWVGVLLVPINDDAGKLIAAMGISRDITESRMAEQALRESEEMYRMLFHRSPLGVFHYDKELRITECNDRFTEIAHLSRENIEGFDLRIINDKELVLILQMVLEGREGTYEGVCSLASGVEKTWVSLHAAPLFDQQGNIKSGVGIAEDITERKKAEEEINRIMHQQEAILNNIPDIAWLKDKENRFIAVNEPFGRACGVKPSDLVGKTDLDIWPLELAERYRADDSEVMASGKQKSVEEPLADKEGMMTWIETIKTPIYNNQGEIIGTTGIARDITERKKIEEKLFQITHDWEETFNSITDMVTVHDKDFNIIHANKAAEKILNLPILDITPQKCYRFYHGTDRPPEGCPSCDCLNTGLPSTTELYEPHLEMFIEITAIPRFDSSNNIAGLIHIVRDITERKKLEDQLRQSQKMEAIGQLAGGIAHDFNNILTAVIGYANILKLKLKDDPLKINIDQILVSSEKGALLTQSLLTFSRQQVSSPEPVDINDIIKNMEKLLLRVIGENIELKTEVAGDLTVMADSIQIDQVLINLCTNARDAMPNGGRLTIETKKVEPSTAGFLKEERSLLKLTDKDTYQDRKFAEISVTDTGIGMDEKIRERIFEPFFTTKEFGKGTGLGLSIVYGIIKQHNGYIFCESKPGKGTTFKIYLPIIKAEVVKTQLEEIPDAAGTAYTVLLAEDEFVVRKLTKQVLEEFGYKVIEAVDGEDAVNKFIANKDDIELLMFDIIMPKMSGKEAYDRIKKITPDIKMILTSGYPADFINKDEIIKEGIHFMAKPVSPARLLKKVREALAN